MACNRKHKEKRCEAVPPPKLAAYHPKPIQRKNQQHGKEPNNDSDDDEILLTEEQLLLLDNDDEVQRKFRDKRIKQIIRHIDNSSNRSNELEKNMLKDESFLEFCDDILETIGIKQKDNPEISIQELIENHLIKLQ